jgi:hypothetical protein
MIGDRDDIMIASTPHANKMVGGPSPFAGGNVPSPGNDWMGGYSQAAASLLSFQRARFRKGRSRHSSSSASGNSSKQSPGPLSPPVMKSIENPNGGYFGSKQGLGPRRESLSLGTRDLRLSDLSDEGESRHGHSSAGGSASESGPLGVIRRAVTRRGSLLVSVVLEAMIKANHVSSLKQRHLRASELPLWRSLLLLTATQSVRRRLYGRSVRANLMLPIPPQAWTPCRPSPLPCQG